MGMLYRKNMTIPLWHPVWVFLTDSVSRCESETMLPITPSIYNIESTGHRQKRQHETDDLPGILRFALTNGIEIPSSAKLC